MADYVDAGGIRVAIQGDDKTQDAFRSATTSIERFKHQAEDAGTIGGNAMRQVREHSEKARDAIDLLADSAGVRVPRELKAIMAEAPMLSNVLAAAFSGAAVVGFIELAAQIPPAIAKITDAVAGWGEEAKRTYEFELKHNKEMLDFAEKYHSLQLQIAKEGLSPAGQKQVDLTELNSQIVAAQAAYSSALGRYDAAIGKKNRLSDTQEQYKGTIFEPTSDEMAKAAEEAMKAGAEFDNARNKLTMLEGQAELTGKQLKGALSDQGAKAAQELSSELKSVHDALEAAYKKLSEGDPVAKVAYEYNEILQRVWDIPSRFKAEREEVEKLIPLLIEARDRAMEAADPWSQMWEKSKELAPKSLYEQSKYMLSPATVKAPTEPLNADISKLQEPLFRLTDITNATRAAFDNMFEDIALGTRGPAQAFESMGAAIEAALMRVISKMIFTMIIEKALSGILGMFSPSFADMTGGGSFNPANGSNWNVINDWGLISGVGPGRAGGGTVNPGMVYPVGENGMEWFAPRTSGVIIPNGAGGAPAVSVIVNNEGTPKDAQAGQPQWDQQARQWVIEVVTRDVAENGTLGQLFGQR